MPTGIYKRKPMGEEQKKKIGLANRGKKRSLEIRRAISERQRGKKRQPTSNETKEKIRQKTLIQFKNGMPEKTRQKLSKALTGKKHSKETIEKRRKSNTGQKRSKEFCLLMKKFNKGKNKGKSNKINSIKMKAYAKIHPERFVEMAKAARKVMVKKGFISKPQIELYLLIKSFCSEAKLEYPIQTKHSTRFADIAIPSLKLDIEYDGVEWHKNKTLDDLRDSQLFEIGWTTIRITKYNMKELNEIFRFLKQ